MDEGPDALLVQKPAAVALCRELGLGVRLVSTLLPRTAHVLRGDRPHDHPHPVHAVNPRPPLPPAAERPADAESERRQQLRQRASLGVQDDTRT